MRFSIWLRLLPVLTLSLVVAVTACKPKAVSMTPEESLRVEIMTAKMTTRCVGRFLIDMPESFVLNSESTTTINGVGVAVRPMGLHAFRLALEARRITLGREKILGESTPSLLSATNLPREEGMVFDRSRSDTSAVLRTIELFAYSSGYAISMHVNSRDMRFSNPDPTDTRITDTPEKLALLLQVYERISGRKDTEIPTAPGLCIPNGFVAGANREGQETDAVYHLVDAPDVWFGFGSSDAVREEDTLLQRSPKAERAIEKAGTTVLRKGTRNIHGQAFEEVLLRNTVEQDGLRGEWFMMNGNELRTDPAQPFIDLSFRNGNRIPVPEMSMEQKDELRLNEILTKATLTEAESLAIWDKVSATLRPRPGAF